MGDRANVVIKGDSQPANLVLYTHWKGHKVEEIVQQGIAHAVKVGRSTDGPYGQRCIVDTFFRAHADSYDDGTGAGIYVGEPYESHVVTVDLDAQTVTFDPQGNEYGPEGDLVTESFAAFAARALASAT